MRTFCTFFTAALLVPAFTLSAAVVGNAEDGLEPLLKTLQSVGSKGAGHRDAAAAWEQLVQARAVRLPVILAGLDDANPLAANWIRTAIDTIAERELRGGGRLPARQLEQFVLDTGHAPRARRLAYEWLRRVDPSAPERLVPKMLHDSSLEMRRDAVARLADEADALDKAGQPERALAAYLQALFAARDLDQVRRLAARLREHSQPVDLPRHFGFLVRWKVIGPFDNTDEKGFDTLYPPEREIDLQASYEGKHGEVQWIDHVTKDDYGKVDLNKVLAKEKAVVAYAMSRFITDGQREVDIRVQSDNAVKVWLNGRLLARHHVYHTGSQIDQYTSRAVLKPGANVILVKVGQNAITPDWADPWSFHLRVCDLGGTAVLSTDRDP